MKKVINRDVRMCAGNRGGPCDHFNVSCGVIGLYTKLHMERAVADNEPRISKNWGGRVMAKRDLGTSASLVDGEIEIGSGAPR